MSASELRPHHALCIGFFEGKGYSRAFTENMAAVIERLGQEGALVKLTCSADVICSACPNNVNERCTTADKVNRFDRTVLEICELTEGDTLPPSELFALAKERIADSGRLGEVCGGCCWEDICKNKTYKA